MKTPQILLTLVFVCMCTLANAQLNLLGHLPNSNAFGAAKDANITFTFDSNIDGATLDGTTIVVTGSQTGLIPGAFMGAGTPNITFNPTNDFVAGEEIRVTITQSLLNETGGALAQSYQFEFKVVSSPGEEDPDVALEQFLIDKAVAEAYSVHASDIDGDGDMDILSSNGAGFDWHENTGNLNFTKHALPGFYGISGSVQAADMNGDGNMDILGIAQVGDAYWFENDGSENFTSHSIGSPGQPVNVRAVDIDGDGDLDAVSAAFGGDRIDWYENQGGAPLTFATHTISSVEDGAWGIFTADVDSDGDMDVLSTAVNDGSLVWFENDGSQSFTRNVISTSLFAARAVHAIDLDQDGDVDIISGGTTNKPMWYENDGSENFTTHQFPTSVNILRSIQAADINGDGHIDVLMTDGSDKDVVWYENDGSENFTYHDMPGSTGTFTSFAVDIDNDSDLDILTSGISTQEVRLYLNTGVPPAGYVAAIDQESITDANHNAISFTMSNAEVGASYDYTFSSSGGGATVTGSGVVTEADQQVVGIDLSGMTDGTITLALKLTDSNGNVGDEVFSFSSKNPISIASTSPTKNLSGVSVNSNIAINFDSNINGGTVGSGTIIVTGSHTGQIEGLYTGAGTSTITFNPTNDFFPGELITIQVTRDVQDLTGRALSNPYSFQFRVINNPGEDNPPSFDDQDVATISGYANTIFLADMDGDSDIDILYGSEGQDKIEWFENNGGFTNNTITTSANGVQTVLAADIDLDGDLDVASASEDDDRLAWYENDGSQNFTEHTITNTAASAAGLSAIDLDGDGDIDLLSTTGDNKVSWYENDGSQNFAVHDIGSLSIGSGTGTIFGTDIDSDGDMDVAASHNNGIVWYENDGNQIFTEHTILDQNFMFPLIYPVDLDGDGDMDVLGTKNTLTDGVFWYENDGNQNFTENLISNQLKEPKSVTAADLNGDGNLDVLVSSEQNSKVFWFQNDGSESFTTHEISLVSPHGLAVADIDGDNDLDLIAGPETQSRIVFFENADLLGPAPVVSTANAITNVAAIPVTINFGEAMTGFELSDVTFENGTPSDFTDNGDGSYSVIVTAIDEGIVTIEIAAAVATDVSGNDNGSSNTLEVTYDATVPTVEINTTASNPTNIAAIPIAIDFSEEVSGFELSDITIENGTPSEFTDNGDGTYSLVVTATADGVVSVELAADVANDLAGNANTSSNTQEITYDGTAPTIEITTTSPDQTNTIIPVTISFSEIVTDFVVSDITIVNGTPSDFTDNGDGSYEVIVTASGDGLLNVELAAGVANDAAGNGNEASNTLELTYDSTSPTVVIATTADDPTNIAGIPVTIDFSEAVAGFEISDLDIVNGTPSDFTDNGAGSYEVTVTASGDGLVSVELASGVASDAAGNDSGASNTLEITYDGTSPTVLLSTTADDPTNVAGIPVTIDFSEAVAGFSISDVDVTNGTVSGFGVLGAGSYEVTVNASGDGLVSVELASGVASDAAGNDSGASNTLEITYDGTSPTVVVATTANDPTNSVIPVTIDFSEAVVGFEISDLDIVNGTPSDFTDNGAGSYEVTVTASGDGLVSVELAAGIATDAAGNANESSNTVEVTYDGTSPTVMLSTTADDPTNSVIPVTIDFSEEVTGFEISDLDIVNGTASDFTDNGAGSYEVTVTASGDGLVSVELAAGIATDAAGNANEASNTLELTYDSTSPTVVIATTADDPTNVAGIPVTIDFSEAVAGFEMSDLDIVNGTPSDFTDNGAGSYEVTVTASGDGLVSVELAAGIATDAAGNVNESSNTVEVTYDGTSPTVALATTANDPTNVAVPVTIDFSEEVTGFEVSDLDIVNGTASDFIDNGAGSYEVTVTASGDGLVSVELAAGIATDAAGNANESSNTVEVTYDGTSPTVTLATTANDPTNSVIPVTIDFSEEVTGFEISDLDIVNGTASDFTDNGAGSYEVTVTSSGDGLVSVELAAGIATDAAGNANESSNIVEVTYDGTSPTVNIGAVVGAITNEMEIPVTIEFSEVVQGFELSDVAIVNGNGSDFVDEGNGRYSFLLNVDAEGNVSVSIASGSAQDLAGNANSVSNTLEFEYDPNALTVLITTTANDPTNSIPLLVSFSEEVTSFELADLTIDNGTPSNFTDNGDSTYSLVVSGDSDGLVTVSISAGVSMTAGGKSNVASNILEITYDGTSPTVEITTTANDPTNTAEIPVTITFSEIVSDFQLADLNITNGIAPGLIDYGDGSYKMTVTASNDGLVSVEMAADLAVDAAGNGNEASNLLEVIYDNTAPTVVVSTTAGVPTSIPEIPVTIEFSEEVIGLELSDIVITNGVGSNLIDNGNGSYLIVVAATDEMEVTVTVPAGIGTDIAGNENMVSNTLRWTYDATSPTINVSTTAPDPTSEDEIPVTITFSEPVTGFDVSDITMVNGTPSNFTDNGDNSYDVIVTASAEGLVSVEVAAAVAADAAGNVNTASNTLEVTYDIPNETPVVVSSIENQSLAITGANVEELTLTLSDHFSDPDGDELTFTATSNDLNIVTSEVLPSKDLLLKAVGEGTTKVTVTASDPDGSTVSLEFNVTVDIALSVLGDQQIEITYYPNPVSDQLTVNTENFRVKKWYLYSISGHLKGAGEKSDDELTIDVSDYASGTYILRLVSSDDESTNLKVQVIRN